MPFVARAGQRSRPYHPNYIWRRLNPLRLEDRITPSIAAWEWQSATPITANVTLGPRSYIPLSLNETEQRAFLAAAPKESAVENGDAALAITLPRPDGGTEQFRLWEVNTFEPGLAAQFPNIKTYRGQGVTDPTAILAADMTEQGFHARVFRGGAGFTIEPVTNVSTGAYHAFFDADYAMPGGFDRDDVIADMTSGGTSGPKTGSGPSTLAFSNGSIRRNYRLAVASAAEYTADAGGTAGLALSAITTVVNSVNAVYERDFCVRLTLVANNNLLIYTNSITDPYTGNDIEQMIEENNTALNSTIGSGNYDIGHVFGGVVQGGLAYQGVVGVANFKGKGGTTVDFDNVATSFWMQSTAMHEMGHQFGAGHTFNGISPTLTANRDSTSSWEPGSGSTLMSYAEVNENGQSFVSDPDAYFHSGSMQEVFDYIATIGGVGTTTVTGNGIPSISMGSNKTIPANTPFALTATGSDGNGTVTYTIEQLNLGPALSLGAADNGSSPLFRSFPPTTNSTRTFPNLTSLLANTTYAPEVLPSTNRTMLFRGTARDNIAGGGAQKSSDVTITVVNTGSAFAVTSPNTAVQYFRGSSQTVTWNVAGTTANGINAATVNILLSPDGGLTFPTTLASAVANDGSEVVTIPNLPTTTARIKVQPTNNVFFDVSNVNFTILNRSMTAVLSSGDLVISDADAPSNVANNWTLTFNGTNYFITDTTEQFQSAPAGGALSNGNKTLTMPASAFAGKIIVNGNNGNDALTLDHSSAKILRNVEYNGGNPSTGPGDKLTLANGSFTTVTHTYSNSNSGVVTYTGAGAVSYTGLEPVDMRFHAAITNMIFTLPAAASDAVLEDFGTSGDGYMQLRSANGTFESTQFKAPTGSLTINRGNAADTMTVTALPDMTAALTLGEYTVPFGAIAFNGNVILNSDCSLNAFAAGTISVANNTFLKVSGAASINLTTDRNIVTGTNSEISSVNGEVFLVANQKLVPTTGSFVGIDINGGFVTSLGSQIYLYGRGGDTGAGQHGVEIRNGAMITGNGSGTVSFSGSGGASTSNGNMGVKVDATSSVTSSGYMSLVGTAGGTGASTANAGVLIEGEVSTSGTSVDFGANASGAGNVGLQLLSTGKIAAMSTVWVTADSVEIANTAALQASIAKFWTSTLNTAIDIGGPDVLGGTPVLGLTDAELDRVTANTLQIGGFSTGPVTISADITRAAATSVELTSNGAITLNAGLSTAGGNIVLSAFDAITQTAGIIETTGLLQASHGTGKVATFNSVGNKIGMLFIPSMMTTIVNGSFDAAGAVQVNGTLRGTGSVGTVTVLSFGKIAPGTSPGKLSTGTVVLNTFSDFVVELNGAAAGTDYDQLAVTGAIDLGGATLTGTVGFVPTPSQVFKIVDNDGTDDVTGTFNGYAEGATVNLSGLDFTISYKGGDGNDVTLTRQGAPAAPTVSSVVFGDGTNQRSMVKEIVVTFSEAVNFSGNVADAFTLSRSGSGGPTGNVTLTANPVLGPASAVTITFSGALTMNGSLNDGFFDFTIDADQVTGVNGKLDGGTDYAVVGTTANKYFRLFGDANGNGTTDLADFAQFRSVFNLGSSSIFDFGEGDNNVGLADFAQFRARFKLTP